ncbi:hypothetical protein BH23CHL6_BH23CHL6_05620 [soil metagenome]
MATEGLHVDLLVLGGGMAGMAAAATAAEAGVVVGVVEKGRQIGGSAALSAGILWTARDYAELRQRMPEADADLGRALVDEYPEAVDWIRASGVEVTAQFDGAYFGFGRGSQIDVVGFFEHCRRRVEQAGGWIVRETAGRALLQTQDGHVRGAQTVGVDGVVDVTAEAVLLATGGFQGDPELVAALVGRNADRMLVRSNPGSVGDGFRMAGAVGAGASRSLSGFYGHLMPYPLEGFSEKHFLPLTQYHSVYMILVNRHGKRFIDESRGDEYSNQALLDQPDGRAILLADERMRREHVVTAPYPHGEVVDRFTAADRAGANFASAGSIDELCAKVGAWGIPPANLQRTLDAYGRAARGEPVVLDAPLPRRGAPLLEAPFHALEVQPAITFTLGGIRIDTNGRVLDRDGQIVPGLFAAGADGGGTYHQGYAGGLALALCFGRRSARAFSQQSMSGGHDQLEH